MFRLNLFLFLCLSSVLALELKHLCEERLLSNAGSKLNAFYQLKLEKDLEPISNYISDTNPSKAAYEEVLGQIFLNRLNITEIVQKLKSLDANPAPNPSVRRRRSPRGGRIGGRPRGPIGHGRTGAKPATYIETAADKLQKLRSNFELLASNRINEEWLARDDLKAKLALLSQDLDEMQISVFENQTLKAFFKQPIAMLDGFTVKRNQSIYLDSKASGTLHFSIYLPFFTTATRPTEEREKDRTTTTPSSTEIPSSPTTPVEGKEPETEPLGTMTPTPSEILSTLVPSVPTTPADEREKDRTTTPSSTEIPSTPTTTAEGKEPGTEPLGTTTPTPSEISSTLGPSVPTTPAEDKEFGYVQIVDKNCYNISSLPAFYRDQSPGSS